MLIAIPYPTMTFLPFFVASEKGFFEDQGVKARCVQCHPLGNLELVELVVEGEIAFFGSLTSAMEAVVGGSGDIRALCATTLSRYPCAAREEIRSFADLKGKKVMAGGGRSNTEVLYLCKQYGWKAGEDIQIVHGDTVGRAKAFQDPSIAAVFARSQYLYWGAREGFRPLYYPEPEMGWYEGGLIGSVRFIETQRTQVQKTVTAIVAAIEYIKKDKEGSLGVALKWIPQLDRESAEGNYEILRDHFGCNMESSVIRYMANVMGEVGGGDRQIGLGDFADLSFLEQACRDLGLSES